MLKYHFRTPALVQYLIISINNTPPNYIRTKLDDHEKIRLHRTKQWAETASMDEVMAICSKLSIPLALVGARIKTKELIRTIHTAKRRYITSKDLDELYELAAQEKIFVLANREIMKGLSLFSQLLNNGLYVPNKDYKGMMKAMAQISNRQFDNNKKEIDYRNMKAVIRVFHKVFTSYNVSKLGYNDLAVLFYLACYDDTPCPVEKIFESLRYTRSENHITKAIRKIWKEGYSMRVGLGSGMYLLTEKGWQMIDWAVKEYFEGVKFYGEVPEPEYAE